MSKQQTLDHFWTKGNASSARILPNTRPAVQKKKSQAVTARKKSTIELLSDDDKPSTSTSMVHLPSIVQRQPSLHCSTTNCSTSTSTSMVHLPSIVQRQPSLHCSTSTSASTGRLPSIFQRQPVSRESGDNEWQGFIDGFDLDAGQNWLYPSNEPRRDYQYSIVNTALFHNTLVALPTGLGKTLIAAVVMFNYYRWYPGGKVLFVAPTRPLVNQQIEACYRFVGIPQEHMCVLSGKLKPEARVGQWNKCRVFFLTPQTLMSDLNRGVILSRDVKCFIVDEAHKSTGDFAYCQAAKFRILALTATPGNNVAQVQQVITNLMISKLESRTETSRDVAPYTFHRSIEKIVVRLDGEVLRLKQLFSMGLTPMIANLHRARVISSDRVDDHCMYKMKMAGDALRQWKNINVNQKNALSQNCLILTSLYHSYDLLVRHGLRAMYRSMRDVMEKNGLVKSAINRSEALSEVLTSLQARYDTKPTDGGNANATMLMASDNLVGSLQGRYDTKPYDGGNANATMLMASDNLVGSHPKLTKLAEILSVHFRGNDGANEGEGTRAIVFSSFRDSVDEITRFLGRLRPLIRPAEFVGQTIRKSSMENEGDDANQKKKTGGQKRQMETIAAFTQGDINVLVSTCIGEEGLDIGQVDLIVCYDTSSSAIRQIQRMGRTGRQRKGRVVYLLSEQWEEKAYNTAVSRSTAVTNAIRLDAGKFVMHVETEDDRMIPMGLKPMARDYRVEELAAFERERDRRRCSSSKPTLTSRSSSSIFTLNVEEKKEFNEKFRVDDFLPKRRSEFLMHSLGEEASTENANEFDLGDRIHWQDRLQVTGEVEHSELCRRFVGYINGFCGYINGSGGYINGSGGYINGSGGYINGSGGYVTGSGGYISGSGGYISGSGGYINGSGGYINGSGGYFNGSGGYINGSGGMEDDHIVVDDDEGGETVEPLSKKNIKVKKRVVRRFISKAKLIDQKKGAIKVKGRRRLPMKRRISSPDTIEIIAERPAPITDQFFVSHIGSTFAFVTRRDQLDELMIRIMDEAKFDWHSHLGESQDPFWRSTRAIEQASISNVRPPSVVQIASPNTVLSEVRYNTTIKVDDDSDTDSFILSALAEIEATKTKAFSSEQQPPSSMIADDPSSMAVDDDVIETGMVDNESFTVTQAVQLLTNANCQSNGCSQMSNERREGPPVAMIGMMDNESFTVTQTVQLSDSETEQTPFNGRNASCSSNGCNQMSNERREGPPVAMVRPFSHSQTCNAGREDAGQEERKASPSKTSRKRREELDLGFTFDDPSPVKGSANTEEETMDEVIEASDSETEQTPFNGGKKFKFSVTGR